MSPLHQPRPPTPSPFDSADSGASRPVTDFSVQMYERDEAAETACSPVLLFFIFVLLMDIGNCVGN